jgi:hypothetical protein
MTQSASWVRVVPLVRRVEDRACWPTLWLLTSRVRVVSQSRDRLIFVATGFKAVAIPQSVELIQGRFSAFVLAILLKNGHRHLTRKPAKIRNFCGVANVTAGNGALRQLSSHAKSSRWS